MPPCGVARRSDVSVFRDSTGCFAFSPFVTKKKKLIKLGVTFDDLGEAVSISHRIQNVGLHEHVFALNKS